MSEERTHRFAVLDTTVGQWDGWYGSRKAAEKARGSWVRRLPPHHNVTVVEDFGPFWYIRNDQHLHTWLVKQEMKRAA